jgi:outer membrane protein assembly factor BamB
MERFATSPTTSDISSPALDGTGNIYLTNFHGVYALDRRGVLRWKRTAPRMGDGATAAEGAVLEGAIVSGAPEREPAIAADGTVYFAAGSLFAFNPEGVLQWQFTPETLHDRGDQRPTFFDRTPILARDGTIYLTTSDGQVYALTSTGTPLWRFGGAKNELLLSVYLDSQGDLQVVQERLGIRTDRQLVVFNSAEHGPLMPNAWPTRFHDFGNARHRASE